MLSKVWSAATLGIDAVRIIVEVDARLGQPAFRMVGLPDAAVREAYSRVCSALHNCGYWLPARAITVNLSMPPIRLIYSSDQLVNSLCRMLHTNDHDSSPIPNKATIL